MPLKNRVAYNAYMREYRRRKKAEREKAEVTILHPGKQAPVPWEKFAAWCRRKLVVPTGPLTGKPFFIPPWQETFIVNAWKPGIREAGLCVARKNGKSGLIASMLLFLMVGPGRRPGWRGLVTSMTGPLAKELQTQAVDTAKASGIVGLKLYKSPPPGRLEADGVRCDFLAADRSTGHAVGVDLAITDESGLLQESQRPLWNAVYSSMSGRNGRMFNISIKGDGPMFQELAERKEAGNVYWQEHATGKNTRQTRSAS